MPVVHQPPKALGVVEDVSHLPWTSLGFVHHRMIGALQSMAGDRKIAWFSELEFINESEDHRYKVRLRAWTV